MYILRKLSLILLSIPVLSAAQNHAEKGVIVIVEAEALPGQAGAVITAFKGRQQRCSECPGCHRFEVTRSDQDKNKVIVIEHWQSIDDHRKEVQSLMRQDSFVQFRQLLVKDLRFQYLTVQ